MSVKTEGQRAGEFLASEGNGEISRESGTLTANQTVVDGQVLKFSAGKLVAAAGNHDTAGNSTESIAGIVIGNWTVTADTKVPYIARLAVCKDSAVVTHTGGADAAKKAAVVAELAAAFVILR